MKNWQTLEPDLYALVGGHRYTPGRTRPIDRIVIHHNAGVHNSTMDLKRLWDTERPASAHYQVETDGKIGQLVNDWDTAWHAADTGINSRSIGIEHANIGGAPRWQISDRTIEEGAHLVAALCHAYKLGRPQWGRNVFPHSQYTSTSCPLQLDVGGEDHRTYMERAQWWFDNWTRPQPTPPRKDDPVNIDQYRTLDSKLELILDQLLGRRDQHGNRSPWPQNGGRTLNDVVCAIAEIEGVTGTRDTKD